MFYKYTIWGFATFPKMKNLPIKTRKGAASEVKKGNIRYNEGKRWAQKQGIASRWETNQELGLRQLPSRQEVWYSFRPVSELTPHIFQILCFCLYRSSHLIYIKLFFINFTQRSSLSVFDFLSHCHVEILLFWFFNFVLHFRLRKDL